MIRIFPLFLLLASFLGAQTAPSPEVAVEVNSKAEATAANGWPFVIQLVVISADGQALNIGLSNGDWTTAVQLTITNSSGATQTWPLESIAPASNTVALS